MLIVVSLLLILLVGAQPNYQQRCIYYTEKDNVCSFGQQSDKVNLIINIDDTSRMKMTISGGTGCYQWAFLMSQAIMPSQSMYYLEIDQQNQDYHYIHFDHQTTKKYRFGLLSQLIQKATIKNPTLLYKKQYNCSIFGDGSIQHFGAGLGFDPAQVYMRCLSLSKKQTDIEVNDRLEDIV